MPEVITSFLDSGSRITALTAHRFEQSNINVCFENRSRNIHLGRAVWLAFCESVYLYGDWFFWLRGGSFPAEADNTQQS
jgi:hypothetical protein